MMTSPTDIAETYHILPMRALITTDRITRTPKSKLNKIVADSEKHDESADLKADRMTKNSLCHIITQPFRLRFRLKFSETGEKVQRLFS